MFQRFLTLTSDGCSQYMATGTIQTDCNVHHVPVELFATRTGRTSCPSSIMYVRDILTLAINFISENITTVWKLGANILLISFLVRILLQLQVLLSVIYVLLSSGRLLPIILHKTQIKTRFNTTKT